MKERVAAEAVMHAAGRENITFIMGLKSATQRLAEKAITRSVSEKELPQRRPFRDQEEADG